MKRVFIIVANAGQEVTIPENCKGVEIEISEESLKGEFSELSARYLEPAFAHIQNSL
jgi:hypothetical protein